jgi:hypothetical protein
MARSKLVALTFTGGGPWDGHELAGERPPEDWFVLSDGRYYLKRATSTEAGVYDGVASYQWAPDDLGDK